MLFIFRYLLILLLTFVLISVIMPVSANFVVNEIEKILDNGVEKIEEKIDTFVQEEIKKVKHELMALYVVMIVINMIYSTILVFTVRRYLK